MDFTYLDNLSSVYAESRILHAAVELIIFDAIGDKRASAQEVSLKLHTDERATLLFLNALKYHPWRRRRREQGPHEKDLSLCESRRAHHHKGPYPE